jgi:hypothetical protein
MGSARGLAAVAAWGFLGLLAATPSRGQILNTLRGFDGAEQGWAGEIGAFFSAASGNTEHVTLSTAAAVQWQGATHRWRLLGEAARAENREETIEESSSLHVRHNARLTPAISSLTFVQHQHDRFQRLDTRFLLGAGARLDFLRREKLEGSWGVSPMLEIERLDRSGAESRGRLSTFVSLLGRFHERASVDLAAFYQPAFDEIADARAVGVGVFRVEVSGGFAVVLSVRMQHDSDPAPSVEKTDWNTRTGLSVKL